jgi:hypothetical protein
MPCGPLPAAFARERLARLPVPFVSGLVVLVPPMFYIARFAQPGFRQPYWRFWLSFLNVPAIARGLLPRGQWTSGGVSFSQPAAALVLAGYATAALFAGAALLSRRDIT